MKKNIDGDDIVFPYVKNVKPALVWGWSESIGEEEESRRLNNMVRKLEDNVFRYHVGWDNKKIHGIYEKEK